MSTGKTPLDNLLALRLFRRIVELGSFARAAEALDMSPGTASKLIATLESHLGVRLLQRTTRRLHLTEPGQLYYQRCARALDELDDAERLLDQLGSVPRGTLRISVPTSFGMMFLSQHIPAFLRAYPELSLDVVLNDRFVDLIEEGFDMALRITTALADSSMVARQLGTIERVVVASPAYLAARGVPAYPSELTGHECLIYSLSASPSEWVFESPEGPIRVPVHGRYTVNNSVMLRTTLVDGMGITLTPRFVVHDLLASGQLREVLAEFRPVTHKLFALLPSQRSELPKVQALVSFMKSLQVP